MKATGPLLLLVAMLPCAAPALAGGDVAASALEPLPASEWTLQDAAHLLRRAGFGGTRDEVAALHALGPDGAVDSLFAWDGAQDPGLPPAPITLTSRPGREEYQGKSREERQEIAREYRREDRIQFAAIREWWIQCMLRTAFPLRERLTLFWHGHFTSGYRDVRNSYHMYVQNTLLRRYAAGDFRALLHEISRDPAMLEYLDNNRNRKGRPNENYAREVMELFTLGVGNYTEDDIKEAARALTGWTFTGNRFVFDRRQHDDGVKTILGRAGNFDGDDFCDILLAQPAAARHIAKSVFGYFAYADPDPAIVEGLASTLRASDWQLKPMLRQLFRSRAFYSDAAIGTRIKSPVELLVGIHRSLGLDPDAALGLSFLAENLGQGLMEPPNVKGWPGGRDWITTSTLLRRYNVADSLVGLPEDKLRTMRNERTPGLRQMAALREQMRADPNGGASEEGMGDTMAPDEMAPGGTPPDRMAPEPRRFDPRALLRASTYDVVAAVRASGLRDAPAIVDHFLATLLAVEPPAGMRDRLVAYLQGDDGFALQRRDARERLYGLLRLIVSTPEFQLS